MMTIGSPFEKLKNHANLVVTISEEKQLFEANLKFVLLRVNAATSLLKWAREEGNPSLRLTVEKMYNVTLMWASIQKQYAEQCLGFSKSLQSILQVEQGLDAIRKECRLSKEKIVNLQKQVEASKRKSDLSKLKQLQEEIFKHSSDEEELNAELQVKFIKGEIFKTRVLKAAFQELTDTYAENASRMNAICAASSVVIQEFPDVPTFLGAGDKEKEDDNTESVKAINELATVLGLTENMPSFHNYRPVKNAHSKAPLPSPGPPRGNSKLSLDESKANPEAKSSDPKSPTDVKNYQESKAMKRLSRLHFHMPKLKKNKLKGKSSASEDDETDNFVIVPLPNDATPSCQPPDPPRRGRRRSKSSIEIEVVRKVRESERLSQSKDTEKSSNKDGGDGSDNNGDENDDVYDIYEEPDYVLPNSFDGYRGKLVRSSSDNTLSRTTSPDYKDPVDMYHFLWSEQQEGTEPIYDMPFDLAEQSQLMPAPKKPLPEVPGDDPPPKPKRGAVNEAFYFNTNDLEKLLNEMYDDSQLNAEVQPAVKKRALKKIQQERLRSELHHQQSVIDLGVDIKEEPTKERVPGTLPGYVNVTKNNSGQGKEESEEKGNPLPVKRTECKQPPKVPARPVNKHDTVEATAVQTNPASDTSPAMAEAQPQKRVNDEKRNKPRVPPRVVHP